MENQNQESTQSQLGAGFYQDLDHLMWCWNIDNGLSNQEMMTQLLKACQVTNKCIRRDVDEMNGPGYDDEDECELVECHEEDNVVMSMADPNASRSQLPQEV